MPPDEAGSLAASSSSSGSYNLVDGGGRFHGDVLTAALTGVELVETAANYNTIAIMGPQGSGKSSLFNAVFGTSFSILNILLGLRRTTQGINFARSPKVTAVPTLIMDLEGSDSPERSDDGDPSLEMKLAAFALAVADVLLINLWAKDVGRDVGACRPLLEIIFQMYLKLFPPGSEQRRPVLLFVFRDADEIPHCHLCDNVKKGLQKIWTRVVAESELANTDVTDFFKIKFVSLPNLQYRKDDFWTAAEQLRNLFNPSDPDSFVKDSEGTKLPASALSVSFPQMWANICSADVLNVPAHRVLVAGELCKKIEATALSSLPEDPGWASLQCDVTAGTMTDFGERAAQVLGSILARFDTEAQCYDAGVRKKHRASLASSLHYRVRTLQDAALTALLEQQLASFEAEVNVAVAAGRELYTLSRSRLAKVACSAYQMAAEGLAVEGIDMDVNDQLAELQRRISLYAITLRDDKMEAAKEAAVAEARTKVAGPAAEVLEKASADMWLLLCRIKTNAVQATVTAACSGLVKFELTRDEVQVMTDSVREACQETLRSLARTCATAIGATLINTFTSAFTTTNGERRAWTSIDGIASAEQGAKTEAVHKLATMAVYEPSGETSAWVACATGILAADGDTQLRGVTDWPDVLAVDVLLGPQQCCDLWRRLLFTADALVIQAMKEQSTCAAAREQEVSMEESLWLQDRFEAILQRVAAAEEEAAWMREELSRQSGGSGLVRVIGALGNMLGHALFG